MGSPNFRFKQFTVWHDRCAMKVGTDGVLLGAWCPLAVDSGQLTVDKADYRVLDIGTGSGLIALMLAQRIVGKLQGRVDIDAIDVDADAVAQAAYNFGVSPWTENLHAHHSALQTWESMGYDLIVSNPPYFQSSLKNPDAQRAAARHTDSLSYSELILHSARLLKEDGVLALVLPIEAEKEICGIATAAGLSAMHITHVHTKPGKVAKRILISFARKANKVENDTFYIESESSPRSEEYKKLTEEFYL